VALPTPVAGLVIRYAYLWRDDARRGQEDGSKDRPCVIVLSVQNRDGQTIVTVAPITHSPPRDRDSAVEIPAKAKVRLGLDDARSWIIATDLNRFNWPGVDLRPVERGRSDYVFGSIPATLYAQLRDKVLALAQAGRTALTSRSE
jgi:hypothetical protein